MSEAALTIAENGLYVEINYGQDCPVSLLYCAARPFNPAEMAAAKRSVCRLVEGSCQAKITTSIMDQSTADQCPVIDCVIGCCRTIPVFKACPGIRPLCALP